MSKKQSCPNKKDVHVAKDLGKRLESYEDGKVSELKTASNILEWEDRNIQYCYERTGFLFSILIGIGFLILAGAVNEDHHILKDNNFFLIGYISWVFGILCYGALKCCLFVIKNKVKGICNILKFYWYYCSLGVIFNLGSSVENILKYKTGICGDYTKLSCAILASLNIDSYIVKTSGHYACAIKIGKEYYILDQHLPLKNIDLWLFYKNTKSAIIYQVIHENENYYRKKIGIYNRKIIQCSITSIEKIQDYLCKYFSISYDNSKRHEVIVILEEEYTRFYDKFTHLSFCYLIRSKIENKLCGNSRKIKSIHVSQEKDSIKVSYAY